MIRLLIMLLFLVGCSTPYPTENDAINTGAEVPTPYQCKDLNKRKGYCGIPYETLKNIVQSVHERFFHKKDFIVHGVVDQWNALGQGQVFGDCEDFALTVRQELLKIGQHSRLALVKVRGSVVVNHAVLVYGGYIIDNRNSFPVPKSELPFYKFIIISGYYPHEPWRSII